MGLILGVIVGLILGVIVGFVGFNVGEMKEVSTVGLKLKVGDGFCAGIFYSHVYRNNGFMDSDDEEDE